MEESKTRGRKPKINNVPLDADENEENVELVLNPMGATQEQVEIAHEEAMNRLHESKTEKPVSAPTKENKSKLINCLKNEIITVKYIPREGAFKIDPRSPLAGGKADTAKDRIVVPLRKDGSRLLDPLTKDEKDFLESFLGLEENALSIYHKPCYWNSSTKGAVNYVELDKNDLRLNLQDPYDYMRYAILRSNREIVCQSQEDLISSPRATYRYVMISNNAEETMIGNKAQLRSECNKLLRNYEDNHDQLLTILKLIEGRRMAPKTSKDILLDKIQSYIFDNPRVAKKALEDKYIETKTIIDIAMSKNVIFKNGGMYKVRDSKIVLANEGETSTYQAAAEFLADANNREVKFKIQELIKDR